MKVRHERLLNAVSHTVALSLVESIRPAIREDEVEDTVEEFAECVRAGIESYLYHLEDLHHRLQPLTAKEGVEA